MQHIFKILLLFSVELLASQPFIATLDVVISNKVQQMHSGDYQFYCSAYGVLEVSELLNSNVANSVCRVAVFDLYEKNPTLRYFAENFLKLNQNYIVRLKQDGCILYASGQTTLSELLLQNGLAIKPMSFKDKEFRYSFIKAQRKAEFEKKGIWKDNIKGKCLGEFIK